MSTSVLPQINMSGVKMQKRTISILMIICLMISTGMIANGLAKKSNAALKEVEKTDKTYQKGLANSSWPCFGHDNRNTRRSPYSTTHIDGTQIWNFSTDNKIVGEPVVGENETIYLPTNTTLYALNPDGTEKWNYTPPNEIRGTPALAEDGTIYFCVRNWSWGELPEDTIHQGTLYALYPNGSVKWTLETDPYYMTDESSLVVDDEGTIYANLYNIEYNRDPNWVTGIIAVWPNGTRKWSIPTSDLGLPYIVSSLSVSPDGTLYGGFDEGLFAVYPSNGTIKWKSEIGGCSWSRPVIDKDGIIYVGARSNNILSSGSIYALYPNGSVKWNYNIGAWTLGIARGKDGTLYANSWEGELHALTSEGEKKWTYSSPDIDYMGGDGTPAVGGKGMIYTLASNDPPNNTYVISLTSEGKLRWNYSLRDIVEYTSSIIIGGHGMIYACSNTTLAAIGGTPSTPRDLEAQKAGEKIELDWGHPKDKYKSNIVEYKVYRGDSPKNLSLLASIDGNKTSYIDGDIEPDHSYHYQVRTANLNIEGPPSNTINITSPSDKTAPTVKISSPEEETSIDSSSVKIAWSGNDSYGGIEGYKVKIDGGPWKDMEDKTNYTFKDLSPGEHKVTVKGYDKAGNEARDDVSFKVERSEKNWTVLAVCIIVSGLLIIWALYRWNKKIKASR